MLNVELHLLGNFHLSDGFVSHLFFIVVVKGFINLHALYFIRKKVFQYTLSCPSPFTPV